MIWSAPAKRSGEGAFHAFQMKSKAVARLACHRTPKQKRGGKSRLLKFAKEADEPPAHHTQTRAFLVQIKVVFQLHPHRDRMPILLRGDELDLLRRSNGAFS